MQNHWKGTYIARLDIEMNVDSYVQKARPGDGTHNQGTSMESSLKMCM